MEDSAGTPDKLPSISRKITACEACRKHKIKCHMRDSQPPCSRCSRMGLRCTLSRNLQTLIEDDSTWKSATSERLETLENAIRVISSKVGIRDLSELLPSSTQQTLAEGVSPSARQGFSQPSPATTHSSHNNVGSASIDTSDGPAAVPASYISQIRPQAARWGLNPSNNSISRDIIARRILTLEQAQILFDLYRNRLDHFLYAVLIGHDSLETTRASSSLLTAAICTVGALHYETSDTSLFERCLKDFVESCAASIFSRQNTVDDIRAMCIGAFWLHEISWILAGSAVRIATELNLHLSFRKAIEGDKPSYASLRLYYLVYICDHHFSIAFGRPPMSRTDEPILYAERLLDSPFAINDDSRLVSQVKIWVILSQVFEIFGADVHKPLKPQDMSRLRRFMIDLDSWRADWIDKFAPNPYVGNYPKKGVNLHHQFAKLYLCAHVFRGLDPRAGEVVDPEVREISNTAMLAATSILRELVSDEEFRVFLQGLPLYFHAMIPFAAIFALKMVHDFPTYINANINEILELLDQAGNALASVASQMHRQHVLVDTAQSLTDLLTQYKERVHQQQPTTHFSSTSEGPSLTYTYGQQPVGTAQSLLEPFGLGSYDFLSNQNPLSGFDAFPFDFYDQHGS